MLYAVGKLGVGTGHEFESKIDSKPFGGKKDVPAYGPESYLKPGVPAGTLSEKLVHASKVYDGMKSTTGSTFPPDTTRERPRPSSSFRMARGTFSTI